MSSIATISPTMLTAPPMIAAGSSGHATDSFDAALDEKLSNAAKASNGDARSLDDAGARAAEKARKAEETRKHLLDFEAAFASMLVKEMRKSVKELIPGDSTDSLGALFDEQIGKQVASGGGLGIANQLARYMEAQGR